MYLISKPGFADTPHSLFDTAPLHARVSHHNACAMRRSVLRAKLAEPIYPHPLAEAGANQSSLIHPVCNGYDQVGPRLASGKLERALGRHALKLLHQGVAPRAI